MPGDAQGKNRPGHHIVPGREKPLRQHTTPVVMDNTGSKAHELGQMVAQGVKPHQAQADAHQAKAM
jgi:hypothetical protein